MESLMVHLLVQRILGNISNEKNEKKAMLLDLLHSVIVPPYLRSMDLDKLAKLGGIDGLARLLRTHPYTGLREKAKLESAVSDLPLPIPSVLSLSDVLDFCHFLVDSFRTELTMPALTALATLLVPLGIQSYGLKNGWTEGAGLLAGVMLSVVVTAGSDFWQTYIYKSLAEKIRSQRIKVCVIREGTRKNVSLSSVVIGDLVVLNAGERVYMNGVLVRGEGMSIRDNKSGDLHFPGPASPFIYSGSQVEEGSGFMLVIDPMAFSFEDESKYYPKAINASEEELGFISPTSAVEEEQNQTPLQAYATRLAVKVGKFGLAGSVLLLIAQAAQTSWESQPSVYRILYSIVNILTNFVAMVVVGVPEGLPLAASFSLAYATRKIMSTGTAMVQRMSAVEDMAAVTSLCVYLDSQRAKPERDVDERLRVGGVKVRWVTGKDLESAKSYAKACGIKGNIVTSVEFRHWNESQMKQELSNLSILAEAGIGDMQLLVKALKSILKEVVAVMKDCSSDGDTEADVEITSRDEEELISTWDDARSASWDMAVCGGSLHSVAKTIEWGRSIYSNTHKFMFFHLSAWAVVVFLNCMGMLIYGKIVLTAAQMMWVNLVMDTLGALALLTASPDNSSYTRGPVIIKQPNLDSIDNNTNANTNPTTSVHTNTNPTTSVHINTNPTTSVHTKSSTNSDDDYAYNFLMGTSFWRHVGIQFSIQIAILMVILYYMPSTVNRVLVFNTLVLSLILNLVGIYNNTAAAALTSFFLRGFPLIAVIIATLTSHFVLMSIIGLSFFQWVLCLGLASISLPVSVLLGACW